MTRTQAVALPFSLGAHGAGLAGVLALAIGGPADLPPPRLAAAAPPPPVTLGPLRAAAQRGPAPSRARPPRRIAAPVVTPPPIDATAPPDAVPPPVLEVDPGIDPGDSEGVLCLGCEIGDPFSTGIGSDGDGPLGAGDGSAAPIRIGGQIREPRNLRRVNPAYPDIARAARVQGLVVLECTLTPQGRVSDIRVMAGHPLLSPAATRAVEQWLFTPTLLNGVPVPVILTVTVKFELR
jgi:periplasmic protein TonB